jgi:hypothetical protein
METDVTHREIYDRLVAVESKVDKLSESTTEVVSAFAAAKGAFLVLEWIAKVAKPILWVAGLGTLIVAAYERFKPH